MSLYGAIDINAQGLSVQRKRMQLVASNIANINTTRVEGTDQPYVRRQLVVEAVPRSEFETTLQRAMGDEHDEEIQGVRATAISLDPSPLRLKYEPDHPHANENGYVSYPNINPAVEMVDMVGVQRSYEANLASIRSARSMIDRTIDLLRG
ncbi:flagellar basal body rod protein FlgC [Acanthopleuribacter pedis]|uniref:Flagellar basal-body rod protein FlgC n=1 Tax=Acanthopleuribacter pedis TaxID=442870 RepID=A0A8J7QFM4_9BACT|nr:flagellar basal body rod protein FlgC [Acanthopleuribacter pedis]MBO1317575.1 flagellar basal body rod protein FlgC [Acanthopleuribacter pedis]